jgi:predicted ATPase
MNRFKRIHIQGFRRLADIDLEMRPLMVLLGANGAGKTSLLDVFSLLAASAAGQLNTKLSELGGFHTVRNQSKKSPLALKVVFEAMLLDEYQPRPDPESFLVSQDLEYEFELTAQGSAYAIRHERLSAPERARTFLEASYDNIRYSAAKDPNHTEPRHSSFETALSQAPQGVTEYTETKLRLSSSKMYRPFGIDPQASILRPQSFRPVVWPGDEGEDLASFLYTLKEHEQSSVRESFELIEETMKTAFPSFEGFGFPPVAAGMLTLTWKDRNFKSPFYLHQLSEGILRFLWLVCVLQCGPESIMIDEPEISLHPQLLSLLADLLREASQRSQIIVATQSDSLVRFLRPEEIVVMDGQEDGSVKATWADTFDLEKWLSKYSLDEIWNMGQMGGRE